MKVTNDAATQERLEEEINTVSTKSDEAIMDLLLFQILISQQLLYTQGLDHFIIAGIPLSSSDDLMMLDCLCLALYHE